KPPAFRVRRRNRDIPEPLTLDEEALAERKDDARPVVERCRRDERVAGKDEVTMALIRDEQWSRRRSGENLGELSQFLGAVDEASGIRRLREHSRSRLRRKRSLDLLEIEPKRPRTHWHQPRLESEVLQVQWIVQPARSHDHDVGP